MLSFTQTRTKHLQLFPDIYLSVWAGNLCLGPFEITEWIRKLVGIFKLQVLI